MPYSGMKRSRKSVYRSAKLTGQKRAVAVYNPLPRRAYASASGELKFFDTALAFTVDATGEVPATGQLSLIPQGVTQSTRIGRQCVIKSIQIRGTAFMQPAAGSGTGVSIIYVILDTQANGAAASVTDVFEGSNLATQLPNMDNNQRFKILKRFVIAQTSASGVAGALSPVITQLD